VRGAEGLVALEMNFLILGADQEINGKFSDFRVQISVGEPRIDY
jgi:hypothetical protein